MEIAKQIIIKSKKLTKLKNLYFEYNAGVISDDDALAALYKMKLMPVHNMKEVELNDTSVVKILVEYCNKYKSLINALSETSFQKNITPVIVAYLFIMFVEGKKSAGFTFTSFIKMLLKENKFSTEEIKEVKDIRLFWRFVKDLEKYITSR